MSVLDFLQIYGLNVNEFLADLRNDTDGSPTLPNGVASGDTGQTSTVLWTRSSEPGFVAIEYSSDPDFNNIVGTLSAEVSDPNEPIKLPLSGLQPNTTYYYRVTDSIGSSQTGTFDTAAELGTFDGLRFGVSGDWRGELAPYPAIANADEKDLDFFLLHGDTIYADYPSPALRKPQAETLEEFRLKQAEVYGDRFGVNTWEDLRASTSVLATIDDHEVTNDFSGGAPAFTDPLGRFGTGSERINDTPLYENGLQAFQEYNPIRDEFYGETGDPRTAGERKLYRNQTYGSDAAVFVLDARSFRDPAVPQADINNPLSVQNFLAASFDPNRTMLGRVQVEDLKQDLLAAETAGVTWKFVMVPEPIQNLGLVNAGDRFEGYAAERSEILNFINTNDIDNVVFVAADVHGTLVNNLTYQLTPGGEQIPTNAFEITTGSVAFDEPFGPTVIDLAVDFDLLSPEQVALFDSLPRTGKDAFIEQLTNSQLETLGYDPVGLQGSPVAARLLEGGYVATQTYGWTEFAIDPTTQELLVTTYGIEAYNEAELNANPQNILDRTPEVVSQFAVTPELEGSIAPTSPPFDNLIVFGDSLSDVGNVFTATSGTLPASPPYFEGRFSNGRLVVEQLADAVGLNASVPALLGGTNYAFGGATTGFGNSAQGTPNVGEQIDLYRLENRLDVRDLVYLHAGSNNFVQSPTPLDPASVVSDLTGHITTLAEAGATTFVVPNLGDFSGAPFVRSIGRSEEISQQLDRFNELLDPALDTLEVELGIDIIELDFASIFDEILANPAAFGIQNTTDFALDPVTGTVVPDPETYLFWDDFHPTATVYDIVTESVLGDFTDGLLGARRDRSLPTSTASAEILETWEPSPHPASSPTLETSTKAEMADFAASIDPSSTATDEQPLAALFGF
ncbi:alkaline phosphatase D family protein [Baaleninema sp.]|uniref:alkaline phosphatase D family protein n=1 Tax=Baaleninema sp. TaxID=3101197 RepID=UPI003CFCAE53